MAIEHFDQVFLALGAISQRSRLGLAYRAAMLARLYYDEAFQDWLAAKAVETGLTPPKFDFNGWANAAYSAATQLESAYLKEVAANPGDELSQVYAAALSEHAKADAHRAAVLAQAQTDGNADMKTNSALKSAVEACWPLNETVRKARTALLDAAVIAGRAEARRCGDEMRQNSTALTLQLHEVQCDISEARERMDAAAERFSELCFEAVRLAAQEVVRKAERSNRGAFKAIDAAQLLHQQLLKQASEARSKAVLM